MSRLSDAAEAGFGFSGAAAATLTGAAAQIRIAQLQRRERRMPNLRHQIVPGHAAIASFDVVALVADVLRLTLALGRRHLLELFLAHRLEHALRCALERALWPLMLLDRKRGTGGFLLGFRLGWHFTSPKEW